MLLPLFQLLAAVPFLTVLGAVVAAWLLRRRPGRLRHGWLALFLGGLVAADTAEPLPVPNPNPATPASAALPAYHSIELGAGAGQYQTCSGTRTYGDVGAMYRYSTPVSPDSRVEVRGRSFGVLDEDSPSGGLRASVGLEHRWAGRLGVLAGSLERADTLVSNLLPTAALRLGPNDGFFVEGGVFDSSPAPLPGPLLSLGVGVAFPRLGNAWEPLVVRAGGSGEGLYLAPSFPVGDAASVEVRAAYGGTGSWGSSAMLRLYAPRK